MNLYAAKPVKYDLKKFKFFYSWSKEFHTFAQKRGGNSEALILKYISWFFYKVLWKIILNTKKKFINLILKY